VNNGDDRLMRCFASVFPNATRDEIRTDAFECITGWDSLRAATLMAVLEEEFGLRPNLLALLELGTFDSLNRYLSQHGMLS
jgi:acyl carrier protein